MRLNRSALYIAIFLISSCISGQEWEWAKGIHYDGVTSLASIGGCDSLGNAYMTVNISSYGHNAPPPRWKFQKYDAGGQLVFEKNLAGFCKTDRSGNSYLIGGNVITKLSAQGDQVWQVHEPMAGSFQGLALAPGGGFVTVGSEFKADTNRSFLKKFDASGNLMWTVIDKFGVLNRAIAADRLGNVYVYTSGHPAPGVINNGHLIKFSPSGLVLSDWTVPHFPASVTLDKIGNVYITGTFAHDRPIQIRDQIIGSGNTSPGDYSTNVFLIKLDFTGNVQWYKIFAGSFGRHYLQVDNGHNVYFSIEYTSLALDDTMLKHVENGRYGGAYILLKYSPEGQLQWHLTSRPVYDPPSYGPSVFNARFVLTDDGRKAFCSGSFAGGQAFDSFSLFTPGYGDLFIAQADLTNMSSSFDKASVKDFQLRIFPNPSADVFTLVIDLPYEEDFGYLVTDVQGQQFYLYPARKVQGRILEQIDMRHFPRGIYFIEVTEGKQRHVRKVILH